MNGYDLLVIIIGLITFSALVKTLAKIHRETTKINKLVDRYNRIDRQFAAREMFNDADMYGDSLNQLKRLVK